LRDGNLIEADLQPKKEGTRRMNLTRKALLGAVAATTLALSLPAQAQFQKPEDAVAYRRGALNVMGNHFARIGAMVNNKVPFDANAVQVNAELVQTMSRLPYVAFGEGTNNVGNTNALPEVWSQPDKFKAAAEKMQDAVAKLNTVAKTGNQDQIKAAFGDAGQACKACHDDFRKKQN
jgi:cytochrome c556